jgi:NADH-quinone oxidoreductase subunit L
MLLTIIIIPLGGFVVLALFGQMLPKKLVAIIGCGTIGASFALTTYLLPLANIGSGMVENWGAWINYAGPVSPHFSFRFDVLSAAMAMIVGFVGLLIHIYSVEYMKDDPAYSRFFAYLNFFVSAMLLLLFANDLLVLFLGWEGVGLCSYLLIGFWHQDEKNGQAAQKALIITRIGDIAFLIALFLFFFSTGTWNLSLAISPNLFADRDATILSLCMALFLIAALSKSAQFPFHSWLPDAMAGPTPVSALLHSSTMVTAGVYLVARLMDYFSISIFHFNFMLGTQTIVLSVVALSGGVTALYAGLAALGQNDIKRVLAYSTISQIGYMFIALGLGGLSPAIFHFVTHAFFKALLFLGAGSVIHAAHGEQDMRKLGGLRKKIPLAFWTFSIGASALAALPLVTSGFYSKDAILWAALSENEYFIWGLGVLTASLTSLYSLRMVLLTFFGKEPIKDIHRPGILVSIPLVCLAVMALIAGFFETPATIGHIHLWSDWFSSGHLYLRPFFGPHSAEIFGQLVASTAGLIGLLLAYLWYKKSANKAEESFLERLLREGFYWDRVTQFIFVGGFQKLVHGLRSEWIDRLINIDLQCLKLFSEALQATQRGRLRWYAAGIVLGSILLTAGVLWS